MVLPSSGSANQTAIENWRLDYAFLLIAAGLVAGPESAFYMGMGQN